MIRCAILAALSAASTARDWALKRTRMAKSSNVSRPPVCATRRLISLAMNVASSWPLVSWRRTTDWPDGCEVKSDLSMRDLSERSA